MFIMSRIVTLTLETLILYSMIEVLKITNDLVVKIFAQVIVIFTNYILSKLFIFKRKEERML